MKDAEAITLNGQLSIRYLSKRLADYMNTITGQTEDELIIYNDTDSSYISVAGVVNKYKDRVPKDKMVEFLDKFVNEKLQPEINKSMHSLTQYMNTFQNALGAKREVIAESGLWSGKKRYALHVWDVEGVRYDKPKVKVTGIETQKSSTPACVRDALMDCLKILLSGTPSELQRYVEKFEIEFRKKPLEDIAFPRGVNNVEKYTSHTGLPVPGCPGHVRAVISFNYNVARKYPDIYQPITSGEKIKFVYLVKQNPYQFESMAFIDKPPKEIELARYVDWPRQFQVTFLNPLETLAEAVKWKLVEESSLDDFFS